MIHTLFQTLASPRVIHEMVASFSDRMDSNIRLSSFEFHGQCIIPSKNMLYHSYSWLYSLPKTERTSLEENIYSSVKP